MIIGRNVAGIMEKNMEAIIVYWGYMVASQKKGPPKKTPIYYNAYYRRPPTYKDNGKEALQNMFDSLFEMLHL